MKSISLTKEQREKTMMSDSEGVIMLILYNQKNGMQSTQLKKIGIALKLDMDELEEAFESLRGEAYIKYDKKERKWHITKDGKSFLKEIASFKEVEK